MIPVLVGFALAALAGWLAVRWLVHLGAAERQRWARGLERIAALSMQEAEAKATEALSDPDTFRCTVRSTSAEAPLESLAPGLRRLLSVYETIEVVPGPRAFLSRLEIGPSSTKPGFVRIGEVEPGTDVTSELAVLPHEEAVHELVAGEPMDPVFGTYTSVYHWILAIAEEARNGAGSGEATR